MHGVEPLIGRWFRDDTRSWTSSCDRQTDGRPYTALAWRRSAKTVEFNAKFV